jgi:hypothetical protein
MIDDENISKLYQRGKQGTPPAHLDDSILNAAREAVDVPDSQTGNETRKNGIAKSPFSGGWPATASIAAVLIITVILVPLINRESDISSNAPVVTPEEESLAKSAGNSNRADDGVVAMKKRLTVQQQDLRSVQVPTRLPKAVTPSMHSDAFNTRSSETLSNMNGAAETDGNIRSGGFMREESAMLGASMGERSLAPQKSRESTSRKTMLYKAKSARKEERLAGEMFESEAMARDFVQSNSMQSEVRRQASSKEMGYGAKPGVMQPKKWLEKISLLLDASGFKQAEIEVEEFRRCYPDEIIGESLLNRLSAR